MKTGVLQFYSESPHRLESAVIKNIDLEINVNIKHHIFTVSPSGQQQLFIYLLQTTLTVGKSSIHPVSILDLIVMIIYQ